MPVSKSSKTVSSTKSKVPSSGDVKKIKVVENKSASVDDLVGAGVSLPVEKESSVREELPNINKESISIGDVAPVESAAPVGGSSFGSQRVPARTFGRFNGVIDNRVIPDADVPTEYSEGVLDVEINGHGILRPEFVPSDRDIYISTSQIRRFSLRPGDLVGGPCRKPKENERYWGLLKIEKINGEPLDKVGQRVTFKKLTPIYPDKQLKLETDGSLAARIIDLAAPIGRGQRGLIVSPPKAGKTTILKQIADGISKNYPEVKLVAVLVGERPEEVTDFRRSIKGTVIASNFDEPPQTQTHAAEIALEWVKRLVEMGKDVVVLLDSITRLARAYNLAIPTSGRTLSGGFDPAALYPPKRFFGAARNIEEGGSLTILGTALVETGSRMDDLIYEEFKGTGNMELHLSRGLEQRRIFPSIDISRSGTRQEQLLFNKKDYEKIATMRRMLEMLGEKERTEVIIDRLKKCKTNREFLDNLNRG